MALITRPKPGVEKNPMKQGVVPHDVQRDPAPTWRDHENHRTSDGPPDPRKENN
jgi:hypothetical protein